MNDRRQHLLLEEPNLYKTFIILATPVFFANLLTSVHDIIDAYFLGQIENSVSSQAAVSLSWPILNIFLALSMGLAVAGVSIISQNMGANRKDDADNYAGLLFVLSIAVGVIINVLLYIFAPFVMSKMGAVGTVYDCCITYIRVRSFEMPFLLMFGAFQAIKQATGDMAAPFYISGTSVFLNIVLTAYFVETLNWGIFGAAFATLIAQVALSPIVLFLLFKKNAHIRITKHSMYWDSAKIKMLFKIGLPSAFGQSISSFGFLILNSMILSYGEAVVAAFSNGNKISGILLMPIGAIGTVQATYMGQNIGASNKDRIMDGYKTGKRLALWLSIGGAAILMPLREITASIMSNNATVISITTEYMFWVLLLQPLMGLFDNYIGIFNGSGKTTYSMIISLSRLWVLRIPLILIFENFTNFGRNGIWYAMVLSNLLILFVAAYLFKKMNFSSLIEN